MNYREAIRFYTCGNCADLAYELACMLNNKIAITHCNGGHAFVIHDGFSYDIMGRRPLKELKTEWNICSEDDILEFDIIQDKEKLIDETLAFISTIKDYEINRSKTTQHWAKKIIDGIYSLS